MLMPFRLRFHVFCLMKIGNGQYKSISEFQETHQPRHDTMEGQKRTVEKNIGELKEEINLAHKTLNSEIKSKTDNINNHTKQVLRNIDGLLSE